MCLFFNENNEWHFLKTNKWKSLHLSLPAVVHFGSSFLTVSYGAIFVHHETCLGFLGYTFCLLSSFWIHTHICVCSFSCDVVSIFTCHLICCLVFFSGQNNIMISQILHLQHYSGMCVYMVSACVCVCMVCVCVCSYGVCACVHMSVHVCVCVCVHVCT